MRTRPRQSENVEAVYPVSPMQEGMLFHSLYEPGSGLYVEQLHCVLEGDLDVAAFRRSWESLAERHTVFRTLFLSKNRQRPVQVVRRTVGLDWTEWDWSDRPAEDQPAMWGSHLSAERHKGFRPDQAPLMRFTLVRTDSRRHLFAWTWHHALLDGWSLPVLFGELAKLYEGWCRGEPGHLQSVTPYQAYIDWVQARDMVPALGFWRQELLNLDEPTPVGIGHPAGPSGTLGPETWAAVSGSWEQASSDTLRRFCQKSRITLNVLVQGAWALLLGWYGRRDTVLFGMTVSGRPAELPGVESMVGLFINTLPVRVDLPPEKPLSAWLEQLQARHWTRDAFSHTPLVEIHQCGDFPPQTPLFETLVVFENYPSLPSLEARLGSISITCLETSEATHYPLTLVVTASGGLRCQLLYQESSFDRGEVMRMLEHFRALLRSMADGLDHSLARVMERIAQTVGGVLPLPSPSGPVDVRGDGALTVLDLFDRRAELDPHGLAVAEGSKTLSYEDLRRRAEGVAGWLVRHGVRPEDRVGIACERSIDGVVAQLAVLKAGAAFVPVDPAYPDGRIRFVLADARVSILLSQRKLAGRLAGLQSSGCSLVMLEDLEALTPDQSVCLPTPFPDQLAYLIYTSGSTGQPKGVMIPHRGLLELVCWHQSAFCVSQADRASVLASTAFDASVWELWPYLTAGSSVWFVPADVLEAAEHLPEWLAAERITIAFLPTPLAERLFNQGWPERPGPLRTLLVGGDRLKSWPPAELPFQVVNNYGPTECSVVATSCGVSSRPPESGALPPIGNPIAHVRAWVVDHHFREMPTGVPGELCLAGPGLARGYEGRPDWTAERFLPNPFAGVPGERLYRTGDLVRRRVDGSLEFLGRLDHQVKVRGFRIELGEVEAALMACSGIGQSVVIAREDSQGETRLLGYVVATDESSPTLTSEDLRALLRQRLPEYMVPAQIVRLEALPQTPNGKIDLRALPAPEDVGHPVSWRSPRSPIEFQMAEVWSEVLGKTRIGVEDDFFALGGHSLSATQLVSRIREIFRQEVSIRTIFETPTIAGLSRHLESRLSEGAEFGSIPCSTALDGVQEGWPLSFAQERLWFLDQWEKESTAYLLTFAWRASGRVRLQALESSFREIIQRHEILRTTFHQRDGRPYQKIHAACPFDVELVDLSGTPEEARDQVLRERILEVSKQALDLTQLPLLRARWFRLEAPEASNHGDQAEIQGVLLVSLHHLLADGWSVGILAGELSALYGSFAVGDIYRPPAPLPVQYRDFAVWQRQWLQEAPQQQQLEYWRHRLEGVAPLLDLPTDHARRSNQGDRGGEEWFEIEPGLVAELKNLSRRLGATLFMTLQAAFAMLLARLSGQKDLVLGCPIANRQRREIEPLIGCFVNMLPLRLDLSGRASFVDLLAHVRECNLEAYGHQDVPFEWLVDQLHLDRDSGVSPLVQVLFTFQNAPVQDWPLTGATLAPVSLGAPTAKHDLELEMSETSQGLAGRFEYRSELFEPSTVKRWAGYFKTLLLRLTEDPRRSLGAYPLMAAAEMDQILGEWNQTAREYPLDKTFAELFQRQAEATPERFAGEDRRGQLTYRELSDRADRVAVYLAGRQAGLDTVVGLLLDRSLDFLCLMLGVLKSGAAYLPLDPRHPKDRWAQVLSQSGCRLVIAEDPFLGSLLETMGWAEEHGGGAVVRVDEALGTGLGVGTGSLSRPQDPQALAYLIFTSGSTGVPKGAMVEQRGMLNHLLAKIDELELTDSDVVAQNASQCFDISVWQFLAALLVGGKVRIIEDSVAHDPPSLFQAAHDHGVTVLEVVPSVLQVHLEELETGRNPGAFLASLRWLVPTGEALPPKLAQAWFRHYPRIPLINAYGPTECSDDVTHHVLRGPLPEEVSNVPVGSPLPNLKIHILDEALQPVAPGVYGELYVGGPGVGRGYRHRPDLTAEVFLPDPFAIQPGQRLYKTGDRGRYLPDGVIEFAGRQDHQIKMRGYRIELGEIEAALGHLAGVREAVVVMHAASLGQTRLVAYLGTEFPVPELGLARLLAERLPEYMIPSVFVQLEALPKTSNGKIDRKALPDPAPQEEASGDAAPQTWLEMELVRLWETLLPGRRIGVRDNFFDLGGHSLLATQLVSRVRRNLRYELTLRQLFEHPTIEKLSRVMSLERQRDCPDERIATRPDQHAPAPLSFGQERMWFLHQLEGVGGAYNIGRAIRLRGRLDGVALEEGLNDLMRRHEILRTNFQVIDGEPVQVIHAKRRLDLRVQGLEGMSSGQQTAAVERLAIQEAQGVFDLASDLLWRVKWLRLHEEDHVLILTLHHAISDGWSMGILIREFSAFYAARASAVEPALAPLPIQYADYAVWQRRYISGAWLETQLQYWKGQLRLAPARLELPTDRPRPPQPSFRGRTLAFRMEPALVEALRAIGRPQGATLFMILQAAWAVLLSRLSGQQDLVLGTPIANRRHPETEPLLGLFINTLALRVDLSGNPSFSALLKRVVEVSLEAFAHQDLPFEKLVDALEIERDLSHHPVFQVLFILQTAGGDRVNLPGLEISPVVFDSGVSRMDLTLSVEEEPHGWLGLLEYNTDLFLESTILRWVACFQSLLRGVCEHPLDPVSSLPLLTPVEERRMLVEWNDTDAPESEAPPIGEWFERQARSIPDKAAVCFRDRVLSYEELRARSTDVGVFLRAVGVGPEVRVGLCLDRSLAMVVGLLGILKAGGAYLPLDPAFPKDRLSYMAEDSGISVLLTEKKFLPEWGAISGRVTILFLDPDALTIESLGGGADLPSCPGWPTILPDQLAYILYTSGSSGKPKGVEITHRGLSNFIASMAREPGLDADDTLLAVTTLSFDISGLEIYLPLVRGARLILADREDVSDGTRLLGLMQRHRVTVMQATPATWRLLLEAGWPRDQRLKILCGGEALASNLADELLPHATALWNLYGPTETTIWSTLSPVREVTVNASVFGSIPIGRPIRNTQVYVVDSSGLPVPVGVYGELLLGGAGLARGYSGRADLTAEKFVPDPFSSRPGARLYRTGDKACFLEDGSLQFAGRLDHQVKVRGFRIELGEVETALRDHPWVKEAVVVARLDPAQNHRLIGYVIPELSEGLSQAQMEVLNEDLKRRLPDYMVPSLLVLVPEFPLLPNGKIDRGALPDPGQPTVREEDPRPRSPVEEILTGLWATILGVDTVGLNDNFFQLGGHSLLVMRVLAGVRKAFDLELPLRMVFESPTVSLLGRQVERMRSEGRQSTLPPVVSLPRTEQGGGSFPQSYSQARMWFLFNLDETLATYHLPEILELRGPLDAEAMRQSFRALVQRHEILRTTFSEHEGLPVQIILPSGEAPWQSVDLRGRWPGVEAAERLREWLRDEVNRPFRLREEPPFRLTLAALDPEEPGVEIGERHLLVVNLHHLISDGWSTGIFIRELSALYSALVDDRSIPLPALPVQYADYSVWQRRCLNGDRREEALKFWREQLRDAPPVLELPLDHPRPPRLRFRGSTTHFELEPAVCARLKAWARDQRCTLFMVLNAALATVLSRYTGREDLIVGTPVANRPVPEVEGLIGFFANTLPIRTRLAGDPTFFELVGRVRQTVIEATERQDLPFEVLVEDLAPERDLSRTPLFQVMLVVQHHVPEKLDLPGLSVKTWELERGVATFDLTVVCKETDSGLVGAVEFNSDLFEPATINRFIRHLQILLEGSLDKPDSPISRLPMLSTDEERTLLRFGLGDRIPTTEFELVHEAFDARARLQPGAIAAYLNGTSITYRELRECSNRVASSLRACGVGPEVLVGLCVTPSFEMLAALLGILKAGGAYVPMDPAYPEDRLRHMLEDSGALVLLTQERWKDRFGSCPVRVLLLEEDGFPMRDPSASELRGESVKRDEPDPTGLAGRRGVMPENLAYVIYTSGSTGQPKGVQVTHRSFGHLIQNLIRERAVVPSSRVLQMISLSFDAATASIFMALGSGASLRLVADNLAFIGPDWVQLLREARITHATFPAPVLALIPFSDLPELEVLITGGEACSVEGARQWSAKHRFFNEYGPTEMTVCATVAEADGALWEPTIGRPLANYQALVLDPWLREVPIGVQGELYLGGIGLARGYRGRSDLTAEKFLPNPFSSTPGERMYRTGDFVRWRTNGCLAFVGREDQQVKIRGIRIELGEIEATLRGCRGVAEAAVALVGKAGGRSALTAYVAGSGDLLLASVKAELASCLPHYMVPSAWVALEKIPLTSNGKIDREALRPLMPVQVDGIFLAPSSEMEKTLGTIWQEVLGRESVGRDDNFFELGGDSILSIQIVARARQKGLSLTVKDLFEHQTLSALSRVVKTVPQAMEPEPCHVGPAPLTPIQEWFFEQHFEKPDHWNQALLFSVPADLDPGHLRGAVELLMDHHEALRSRFDQRTDRWFQVVERFESVAAVEVFDWASQDPTTLGEALSETATRLHGTLNLGSGPLFRVALFRLGGDQAGRLLLIAHHLVVDGLSWRILLSDLGSLLSQLRHGGAASMAPRTSSFMSWAARVRREARRFTEKEADWWVGQLTPTVASLPSEALEASTSAATVGHVVVSLDAETTRALLEDTSQAFQTQVNDLLLTALVGCFRDWTGASELLVDLESHGRPEIFSDMDLSRTVGWFTCLYPLRLSLPKSEPASGMIRAIKEQLRRVPNLGLGYGLLRFGSEDLAQRQLWMGMPSPEVGFNYLGQFSHSGLPDGLFRPALESSGEARAHRSRGIHGIDINCTVVDGVFRMQWSYCRATYRATRMEDLAANYLEWLKRLIHSCQSSEARIPL